MTDQIGSSENSAISCEGLWQVFGENTRSKLDTALASVSTTEPAAAKSHAAAELLGAQECVAAVRDVNFSVARGELFVVMGLSGSGKSTLIRCLSRLIEPTAGQVKIFGEDVLAASDKRMTELRRGTLGMVFQHFGLFPHMTVTENVAFPLKMQGIAAKARVARAEEVISLVGLEGREASYPRELSGGQRQRVGIARSLAANPDIWFLDEPFSALDPLIRRQLQDEFLSIQANLKKSIVFITHDITEALKLADRIAIMKDGEVVQIGTPADIVLRPANDYVREFSRDVAKGRHATVQSIMSPAPSNLVSAAAENGAGPVLAPGMTLEAALSSCVAEYEPVPVRDDSGAVIGVVDPADLANALQTDQV